MSQKTAKAIRRDVRRAVGETATALIAEISTAIREDLYPTQHQHTEQIQALLKRVAALERGTP